MENTKSAPESKTILPPYVTTFIKIIVSIIIVIFVGFITYKYSYVCVEGLSLQDIYCDINQTETELLDTIQEEVSSQIGEEEADDDGFLDFIKNENCSFDIVRFLAFFILLCLPTLKLLLVLNTDKTGIKDFKYPEFVVKLYEKFGLVSPILFLTTVIYFILFPMLRWFYLNFSCEVSPTEAAEQELLEFQETISEFGIGDITLSIPGTPPADGESKFLPGQVFHINDTVSQETLPVVLDEPANYNPLFNNYLRLVDGSLPSIPDIPMEEQSLSTTEDTHNRVYRTGAVEGTTHSPCNQVEIDSSVRSLLSGINSINDNLTDNGVNIGVSEYELKRIECAEHNGQCYMDQYPCQTSLGVPIPLKNIDGGLQGLTVGEITDNGCSKATYPCSDIGETCTTLGLDITQNTHTTGHLIEIEGTCQSVVWSGDDWVNDLSDEAQLQCIPSTDQWPLVGSTADTSFLSQCRSIPRLPQTTYEGDSAYYTWSFSPPTGNHLCETPDSSGWTGNCEGGLENKAGVLSYPSNSSLDTIQGICCQEPLLDEERGTFEITTDYSNP